MKRNIAIIGSILLVLSILVFFTGCPGGVMKLDNKQQVIYDGFINALVATSQAVEVSASVVKGTLDIYNPSAKTQKFKIVDKKPDTPVAKGSTAEQLKKRFIPAKL